MKKFIQENWYNHKPSCEWYDLIRKYAKGKKIGLDIGTSAGFSACAMALEGVDVVSIDPNLKSIAHKVAKELGLNKKIIFSDISSDQYFEGEHYLKWDIIIIDGCHDYEFVKRDLENSWKLLNDNGVIICDDYERYNGVNRAIKDWLKGKDIKHREEKGKMLIWKE